MGKVLLTGAGGFVGRRLTSMLQSAGHAVVPVVHRREAGELDTAAVADIGQCGQWPALLRDVDSVVHLAARTHVTRESSADPLQEFRRVNVEASKALAQAAAAAGVRRFVFISSIRVNGCATFGLPFREWDEPHPSEPYEISKWEAERTLLEIGNATGMQITRVRPTLVVGPGAKGNLQRLMRLVDLGIPLPLGGIRNRRSLISIESLCALLMRCITCAAAADELFIAADDGEVSTPELLRYIAAGLGKASSLKLLPVPPVLLRSIGQLLGRREAVERMTLSLCASGQRAREMLGWKPEPTIEKAVFQMARTYRQQTSRAR